jgi:hypothetical protein
VRWTPAATDITDQEIDRYEALAPLVQSLHQDVQELAKKKQDGALTKVRIALINRLLADVKEFLKNQPSAIYLDLLDEAMVPQNADALLIVGQYLAALHHYQDRYTYRDKSDLQWKWATKRASEPPAKQK